MTFYERLLASIRYCFFTSLDRSGASEGVSDEKLNAAWDVFRPRLENDLEEFRKQCTGKRARKGRGEGYERRKDQVLVTLATLCFLLLLGLLVCSYRAQRLREQENGAEGRTGRGGYETIAAHAAQDRVRDTAAAVGVEAVEHIDPLAVVCIPDEGQDIVFDVQHGGSTPFEESIATIPRRRQQIGQGGGEVMPEKWTGHLVGKMHNHDITMEQLAGELGVTKSYVSMILNSKRKPTGVRKRMETALETSIRRREEEWGEEK